MELELVRNRFPLSTLRHLLLEWTIVPISLHCSASLSLSLVAYVPAKDVIRRLFLLDSCRTCVLRASWDSRGVASIVNYYYHVHVL